MPESWLELSSVSEPEAADAVAEVFGRIGRGVAIDHRSNWPLTRMAAGSTPIRMSS